MKLRHRLFLWINIGVALITLLAYLSPFVHPHTVWYFNVLGLLYPWLLLVNVIFAVLWIFSSRQSFCLLSIGTILLGWSYFNGIVGLSTGASSKDRDSEDILVMSYNVQAMKVANIRNKNLRQQVLGEIEKYVKGFGGPDIICVQDLVKENESFFRDQFKLEHRYTLPGQSTKTGIFSRFPIENKGVIDFRDSYNSCVWADVRIKDKIVRVYSIHLESNRISRVAEEVITEGDLKEEKTWKKVRSMFGNYKRTSVKRAEQAVLVAEHIATSPHPVIVCGDLNDTPLSYSYRKISHDLQDAFRRKGSGLGTTYAGGIPGLRIDYIFADEIFSVLDYKILKDKAFSDHYPVLSNLAFKEAE